MALNMQPCRPRILVFARYYLPGFKSGGPVRSISNLIEKYGDEFEFRVVTMDRDFLDQEPYKQISTGWQRVGKGEVIYLASKRILFINIIKIMLSNKPDLIYLNSFFDPVFSFPIIFFKWLTPRKFSPIFCAPRGELQRGALETKKLRKKIYLWGFNRLNLKNNISFHATSAIETETIKNKIGGNIDILLLSNITKTVGEQPTKNTLKTSRIDGMLQISFLGRIHPKKNLLFAIMCLGSIKTRVAFHIYGPIEDQAYWIKCQSQIRTLPKNITVKQHGPIPHELVGKTLSQSNLFLFPTMGENFGHVIIEALRSGVPVITSDQTPWTQLQKFKLGWCISLQEKEKFIEKIIEIASWNNQDWENFDKDHAKRLSALELTVDNSQDYATSFHYLIDSKI